MSRGIITLSFDDGYTSTFRDVVPELNRLKIPAVFAPPIESEFLADETGQPLTSYRDWLSLSSQGHEIAAHGIRHVNLASLSAEQLEIELAQPAKLLGATTMIYPGGAYNDSILNLASKYYQAGRTVEPGFESLPPSRPLQLKTFNYTIHNSWLWLMNARAAYACLTNSWLIETYHLIQPLPSTLSHTVDSTIFRRHLQFIRHLPVAILTVQQVFKRYRDLSH